jgi:hypothetical protein
VTVKIRSAFFLALVVCSAFARPAGAIAPVVNDRGKFFSSDAVKKANEALRGLYLNEKDLLIETYEGVPADNVDKVKAMSKEERLKFFKKWAETRAEQRVVRGVYILICKEPTMIYVEVTPKVRSSFDEAARAKLRDKLVEDFRAKNFDDGLGNAVRFVKEKLGTR